MRFGVLFQLPAQPAGQQNRPQLPPQGNLRLPGVRRLHGDILHLAHPDAGGADGLQQQGQPLPPQPVGGVQKPLVLLPGELPPVVPEQPALNFQGLDFTVLPAQKGEKLIYRRHHGIDGDGGVSPLQQTVPPGRRPVPGDLRSAQPGGRRGHVPNVFFNGAGGALLLPQLPGKGGQLRARDAPFVHVISLQRSK